MRLYNAYEFGTIEMRDDFLSREYLDRECTAVPGWYVLPNGRQLNVLGTTICEFDNEAGDGDVFCARCKRPLSICNCQSRSVLTSR